MRVIKQRRKEKIIKPMKSIKIQKTILTWIPLRCPRALIYSTNNKLHPILKVSRLIKGQLLLRSHGREWLIKTKSSTMIQPNKTNCDTTEIPSQYVFCKKKRRDFNILQINSSLENTKRTLDGLKRRNEIFKLKN